MKLSWLPYNHLYPDCETADFIIWQAVIHGLISWKIYNYAAAKINRVENESWMFEGGKSTIYRAKW